MSQEACYDVIVIGSGAAGSMAAKELGEQGVRVLLLEAGRDVSPEDAPGADRSAPKHGPHLLDRAIASLCGQPLQARVAFFKARSKRFLVNDLAHRYLTPANLPFLWIRGRQVGGRLHVYGRVLQRWSDHEFKRSAGARCAPWPIAYDELAPFYDKAERVLALHGNRDGAATAPDGIMAGPSPLTEAESGFKAVVEARWPDRRVIAWRQAPPDEGPLPQALVDALASGHVTLRANAIAAEILTDPETRLARGVRFVDRITRQHHCVFAKAVMICASPIESIRLMLNSRSPRHPDGIGNTSGLLGRYFMDQPAALVLARFAGGDGIWRPDDVPSLPRIGTTGGVFVLRSSEDAAGRLGCSYQGSIGRSPHVRPSRTRDASFMAFGEMLPHADNRISLHATRRDGLGIPVPIISCALHDEERAAIPGQIANMVAMIEASGGKVTGWVSPLGLEQRGEGIYRELNPIPRWIVRKMLPSSFVMGAAIHESGGARMGDDPAQSVLNRFNQCWDAPNLFVTDASAFPTSGVMGTTLTIMALSLRACGRLVEQLRHGEFCAEASVI